jgi:hypothetical protein
MTHGRLGLFVLDRRTETKDESRISNCCVLPTALLASIGTTPRDALGRQRRPATATQLARGHEAEIRPRNTTIIKYRPGELRPTRAHVHRHTCVHYITPPTTTMTTVYLTTTTTTTHHYHIQLQLTTTTHHHNSHLRLPIKPASWALATIPNLTHSTDRQ